MNETSNVYPAALVKVHSKQFKNDSQYQLALRECLKNPTVRKAHDAWLTQHTQVLSFSQKERNVANICRELDGNSVTPLAGTPAHGKPVHSDYVLHVVQSIGSRLSNPKNLDQYLRKPVQEWTSEFIQALPVYLETGMVSHKDIDRYLSDCLLDPEPKNGLIEIFREVVNVLSQTDEGRTIIRDNFLANPKLLSQLFSYNTL